MRNLVFQVDIPGKVKKNVMHGYFSELYDLSKIEFLNYAKKVEADYLCIHKEKFNIHPTYERFQIFDEEFDRFDNILYVDCDVIPTQYAGNIFEEYKGNDFVAFSEGAVFYGNNEEIKNEFQIYGRMENIIKRREDKGYIQEESTYLSRDWLEKFYFNAGIFVVSRETRKKVRNKGVDRYLKRFSLFDQSALNKMVFENNIQFTPLSYKYNGLFHFYSNDVKAKLIKKSYFIHFCGPMKNLYREIANVYGNNWYNKEIREEELLQVINKVASII